MVLPLLAARGSWAWWGYSAACAFLYCNVHFNYLATALTDPGDHRARFAWPGAGEKAPILAGNIV